MLFGHGGSLSLILLPEPRKIGSFRSLRDKKIAGEDMSNERSTSNGSN